MTEWYVGTMEDFWSGEWDGSDAAYIFAALFYPLLFGVPFFWSDIVFCLGFIRDLLMQPVYGGALLVFIVRMRLRR